MKQVINLDTVPNQRGSLIKHMLIGGTVGLVVILLFVLPVKHPPANWGQFWIIKPLVISPLSGAAGGLVAYFMPLFRNRYGWNKVVTLLLTALICVMGLWIGIVLGLNGTLWN